MAEVIVLAADGFETVECLTVIDVLRRGGVDVALVSINDTPEVESSQKVAVSCDCTLDEADTASAEHLVLPGGKLGVANLRADERVCNLVREFMAEKQVDAICAAPSILAELGLLEGRHATCFPGFDADFPEGVFSGERTVVVDGNLITASGMALSLPFALAILEEIAGLEAVERVKEGVQLPEA